MIKDGTGGANTNKNGLKFEAKTDIRDTLLSSGWTLLDTDINKEIKKIEHDNLDIFILQKAKLYVFLKSVLEEYNYKDIISKQLLPDNVIINVTLKKIKIIEVKFQNRSGSVDEKLQTCDFKKKQYEKLANPIGFEVEYIYILNDWFKHDSYRDVLEYIESRGSTYYFNELPVEEIFK